MKRVILLFLLFTIFALTACNGKYESEMLTTASELVEKGELNEAVDTYQQLLEKEEKSEEAYMGLSRVYMKQDKKEEAIKILKKGLQVIKKSIDVKRELGYCYMANNEYDLAEDTWKEIIESEPKDVKTYKALVTLYNLQDKLGKAISLLEDGIEANPKNATFYAMTAGLYLKNGEMDEGIETVIDGLAVDINERIFYDTLSIAYKNGYSSMVTDGEELVAVDKKNQAGMMLTFYGYFLEGNFEKAVEAIKPIQKKIKDEAILVRFALACQLSGEEDVAIKIMDSIEIDNIKDVSTLTDILYYYETIGDTEKAVTLGDSMVKEHKEETLYWVLYSLTKDSRYLEDMGLLKWQYESDLGDVVEITGLPENGTFSLGSRITKGDYWSDDYQAKIIFQMLSKDGKEQLKIEDDIFGDLKLYEDPQGQIYYQMQGYESTISPLFVRDKDGKELWSKNNVLTEPVFGDDGTIYVGAEKDEKGYLQALDANGKEKWSVLVDQPQTPVVDEDGTIYTSTYLNEMSGAGTYEDGGVFAVNADGTVKWKYETNGTFSDPIVLKDKIIVMNQRYMTEETSQIIGLAKDGKKVFTYTGSYSLEGILAVTKDFVLVKEDSSIIAINQSGKEAWTLDLGNNGIMVKENPNGGFYAAVSGYSGEYKVVSISNNGKVKWEHYFTVLGSNDNSTFKDFDGFEVGEFGVHIITLDNHIRTYWMINHNGAETWKEELGRDKEADLHVHEGNVYLLSGTKLRVLVESFLDNHTPYSPKNSFAHVLQAKVTDEQIMNKKTEIHYPNITYAPNQDAISKWNKEYQDSASKFEKYAKDMIEDADEYGGIDMLDFSMNYEVKYNNQNRLSILKTVSEYSGGAHSMSYRENMTIDLASGKELTLKELLGKNYREKINKAVQSQMYEKGYSFFEEFTGIEKDPGFYLTEEGVVVYFELYEYTPYSDGYPEFIIPFEQE